MGHLTPNLTIVPHSEPDDYYSPPLIPAPHHASPWPIFSLATVDHILMGLSLTQVPVIPKPAPLKSGTGSHAAWKAQLLAVDCSFLRETHSDEQWADLGQ
ncbi:hypothetical protein EVG20_g7351 [Dentipellis fragilis]|uniref:Uncharacterized protein n=1 Tax=Dentipellis fragilis TaxID=205917 RepID=A0A4Y9YF51_9AGAM|nr:hypothetical protein EVG20_g7351 [Dentipellis fragilis]